MNRIPRIQHALFLLLIPFLTWGCYSNEGQNVKEEVVKDDRKPARLQFRTDPRVETLYYVFLLTDYPLVSKFETSYKADALTHFSAHKDHRAVMLVNKLTDKGFGFDYAVNWLFQQSDFPEFEPSRKINFPFEARPINADTLELFRKALVDFYQKAECARFLQQQKPFLDKMVASMRDSFSRTDIINVIESYFGIRKNAEYAVIASPLMHSGGFAIERTDQNAEYALVGPNNVENGIPQFDKAFLEQDLVIHEFSHNYANDIVKKHLDELSRFEATLYPPVKDAASNEGYGSWEAFLLELMVRATTIRIVDNIYGEEAAEYLADYERSVGFQYVDALGEALKKYESNRNTYKDFDAFFSQLVKVFEELEKEDKE